MIAAKFLCRFAVILMCGGAVNALAAESPVRILDDFRDLSAWTAVSSDQVTATLRSAAGTRGPALCLGYDFHGVSGYAAMRRTLPIDYPDNYGFSFRVRGEAPDNALQFKVADAKGENVWWVNQPDFVIPREWREEHYKKRQIGFAWGPTTDKTLRHSESIEFTVYAGKGGRGEICFDELAFQEVPPPPAVLPKPLAKASSFLKDAPPAYAVDGDPTTAWHSDSKRGSEQSLTLDLGMRREFGGVVLHWIDDAFASRYDVQLSDDGRRWRGVRSVRDGNGGVDPLYLPESEARYLRLALHGSKSSYALGEIEIKDLTFGASANAFFAELAKAAPRGRYPRGFYNEQTYWTIVGIDGGHETGLLSEDGALEVARGGFSIEPFVLTEDRQLLSWADVDAKQSLLDGYLPIPSVHWRRDDIALDVETFAAEADPSGAAAAHAARTTRDSNLYARYTLTNNGEQSRTFTLALAVRPFQVNPSVQFLNTPGGISPIHDLAWQNAEPASRPSLIVNGKARVFPLDHVDAFFASAFDSGMAIDRLAEAELPVAASVHDDTGFASGVLLYRIELPPRAARSVVLQIPLDGESRADQFQLQSDAWYAMLRDRSAAAWRGKLDGVSLRVPAAAQPLADTLRTALAHMLISRDGAAIRPGTRSYARSWIRDGAMMSEGFLRLGRDDAARDYLEWFAPYQFKDGKVPCCVDARGSDPVPENDSHGELIYLASELYRYTGYRALLRMSWPHVDAAARYMDVLRASERTEANRSGDRAAFYGLMPASISHEGYSAKPMHSYWDDFWALTGYKNAVSIAAALGETDAVARLTRSRDEFRADLYASIRTAVAAHDIAYLPGCAELGDFDATSTTIALSPAGEQANLPQDLLHATFERYWKQFTERRDGITPWKDYTPYEWRTVASFVRLGWRERAHEAIDFFMHDRRPAAWNQWAEVVGRDPRESRFVGDMPHGWVASDFIRSVLDLFAYEREADQSLVIAAGIPAQWLDGDGVSIESLRTPFGKLGYSLRRDAGRVRLAIGASDLKLPPGGLVFIWPEDGTPGRTRMNGRNTSWSGNELRIRSLPASVDIESVPLNAKAAQRSGRTR